MTASTNIESIAQDELPVFHKITDRFGCLRAKQEKTAETKAIKEVTGQVIIEMNSSGLLMRHLSITTMLTVYKEIEV